MMHKYLGKKMLSVMLVLVMTASLLLSGSVTAFAAETVNVTSAAELTAALNKNTPVEAINITESFTVNDDCTIQLDPSHLANYHNTVMTIADGVTLTVANGGLIGSFWPSYEGDWQTPPLPNARVINNGTIIVENGGATVADFDTNNGTITVKAGGEAVCCNQNYGMVTVEAGGRYCTTQDSRAVNHGTVTIYDGAAMESCFGTTIENAADGTIVLNGEFDCGCIGDGFWFENDGTVSGSGMVVLYEAHAVSDMDALIVNMMAQLGQDTRFENWEDIDIFKLIEVSDYTQLKSALTGDRVVAGETVNGDMDTLIVLSGSLEIPAGEAIGTMAKITVPQDASLTVNTGAALECGLENKGTVDVQSGAQLATTMGGDINNHATLLVRKDAELKSQMGGRIVNGNGAALTVNGTCYCGCIGIDGHDVCWFENSGDVCGNGAIVLYEADSDVMPISDMQALTESVAAHIGEVATVLPDRIQLSHRWGPWEQTKAPTCVPGVATSTCEVCGATQTKEIPAALSHKYESVITKATLDKNGKIVKRCSVCKSVASTTTIYMPKTFTLSATAYTYDGKKKTPAVTVKDAKGNTVAKTYYSVAYKNHQNVGTATATVTFKGRYSGTKTLKYKIYPKSTSISKLTPGKSAFTVNWKKQAAQTTGYQLQYSTDKAFKKGVKIVTVAKPATVKKTISKLTKNKTYYVRIRTYKKIGTTSYPSAWSKTVSVKTK